MQKTALITGGSKGIGLAIVKKFLSEGFHVISISRSMGELEWLNTAYPGQLTMLFADLSQNPEVHKVASEVDLICKHLDVLVNNAGVFIPGEIHTEEDRVFELQMALNLNAAYYLSKAVIPLMKVAGDAYMFNICSTASIMAYDSGGAYCISKHALLGMTKVLRKELMAFGVAVSAVLPGATYTESWSGSDLPEDRFIKTSALADAIWFAWQNRQHAVMEEILLRPFKGDI